MADRIPEYIERYAPLPLKLVLGLYHVCNSNILKEEKRIG